MRERLKQKMRRVARVDVEMSADAFGLSLVDAPSRERAPQFQTREPLNVPKYAYEKVRNPTSRESFVELLESCFRFVPCRSRIEAP